MNFYQKLKAADLQEQNTVITFLSGPEAGTKLLLTGEQKDFAGAGIGFFDGQEVFYERLPLKMRVVICGAGYVAQALVKICSILGYDTTVIEDRPSFAEEARRAGARQVVCDSFEHALEDIAGGPGVFYVIMTRGHRYDMECLHKVLRKPFAYIGLMASRRRAAAVRESLVGEGFSKETTALIHSPVGLMIGAQTPEEIAVSVCAELIQVMQEYQTADGFSDEMLDKLCDTGGPGCVLATIIKKNGPAPRKPGTKMLICEDGRCIGTIGGGCSEAEIVRLARLMIHQHHPKLVRHIVDLSEMADDGEGMACGGTIEVLLEVIR